jgi:hypothetical protein
MTSFSLGENSNCFVIDGEDPSPTSDSFSFNALGDRLVVGFLGGIVPAIKKNPLETAYRETMDKIHMKCKHKKSKLVHTCKDF